MPKPEEEPTPHPILSFAQLLLSHIDLLVADIDLNVRHPETPDLR